MTLIQTTVTGFEEYHKIETLFERKENFSVDPTKLKKSVFGTINAWEVTEKIDGTNIRVMLGEDGEITFGGRSNNAQVPADLMAHLIRTFTSDAMRAAFWLDGKPTQAILYGEAYGPGIQKCGVLYRSDKSFILFDVLVGGLWWLDQNAVTDVAAKLDIQTVPYLGRMTLDQIVDYVRLPFASQIGTAMAEGVVARPIETLFDKKHNRVILKLKTRDFQPGKR